MIKKIIWTVVFVSMGMLGSLASFGIADILSGLYGWGDTVLSQLWGPNNEVFTNTENIFALVGAWGAFIVGTLFMMVLVAPLWYTWKGSVRLTPGGVTGLILSVILITVLHITPMLVTIVVSQVESLSFDDSWYGTFNMVFTWIVIAIALVGVWFGKVYERKSKKN